MILKLLLTVIMSFVGSIFAMINTLFPATDVSSNLATNIATIINISNQALNFVHFIVGDSLGIIIPTVLTLLTYKYLVLPIIDVVRRLIPFVNL